jgi:hypothetical protein
MLDVGDWPFTTEQILTAHRRFRGRSGHVRALALTISVENDPEPTLPFWL